jgi:transposase
VAQKADITLIELQAWIANDHRLKVSIGCLWARIRHLGLTLKKSRNAPQSKTAST